MSGRTSLAIIVICLLGVQPTPGEPWDLTGARPEVRGAALWVGESPIYLVGVWVGSTVTTSPSLYKPDVDGDTIAYSQLLSAETAPLLGINSAHPPMSALTVMRSTGWFAENRHTQPRYDDLQAFVQGLGGLPVTVDCAQIKAFESASVPKELKQVNPGWHSFVPLCPEHPQAWQLYESYWKDCARQIVEAGSNAIIYELFNEPAYNCRCDYNKREFAKRMAAHYQTIEAANAVWHTQFHSFDAVSGMEAPEQTPGLWCDWIKFIGDRYVEVLAAGKAAIKSVDTREPMYFLDQPSVGTTYLCCNGIDPVKLNALMDIVGMEGGVSFGASRPREEADPMAVVLESKALFSHQLFLDMARAFGKPIVNTETYCGRFYNNVRFSSHRQDILTELWEEMIHGAAGSYFYNWGRRWWEWQDLAGAKRSAREIKYKAYSMLNPYAFPPESLEGFKDFQRDMEIVGDALLGGPRIEGQVALLISQPTVRQVFRGRSYTERGPYRDVVREWYAAVCREQIPVDVVWEEQLEAADLSRYRALLAPEARYLYRASEAPLRRYVDRGGLLLATTGAFAMDEYGEPWQEEGGMAIEARFLSEELAGPELQSELQQLLLEPEDFREFTVVAADDENRPLLCEAHRIRRAWGDYYYLVNWETTSRLVSLKVPAPVGQVVMAPLEGAVYVEGEVAGEGVLIHLPSQTRVLVSILKPGGVAAPAQETWTDQDVRARFDEALKREQAELAEVEAELAAARQAADALLVTLDGPLNETGEYEPDEGTVLLLHLNGGFDEEPRQTEGPVSFVEGKFGTQALHVGEGGKVQLDLPEDFDKNAGTIELWARPDWLTRDGKRHTLVELDGPGAWNQNRLLIYKNLDYEISFVIWDHNKQALAVQVPVNIFRQGQWTHVAGTWDANEGLKFYVNGELAGTAEGQLDIERLDTIALGNSHGSERPWVGSLDEMRLSRGQRVPRQ